MTTITIALALASAVCLGLGLVITQLGLRYMPPIAGAAIALSFSTILFLCAAPFVFHEDPPSRRAVLLFMSVGILFPAAATLLTLESNRLLGPIVTGTFGNLALLFAAALAFVLLGEPLRSVVVHREPPYNECHRETRKRQCLESKRIDHGLGGPYAQGGG
jgi:drug/metabolite transporter (DMT)-like permease